MKRVVSGTMLMLLIVDVLACVVYIQPVKASGTITIRADGSIDPSSAQISTTDNVTYTFTDNIHAHWGIIVQRNNVIIDGNGYTISADQCGFTLGDVNNVTIENTTISGYYGIIIYDSNNNSIIGNTMKQCFWSGVYIMYSSQNNTLHDNRVYQNFEYGFDIRTPNNTVSQNWIQDCFVGIRIGAGGNRLTKNQLSGNDYQLDVDVETSNWEDYIEFIDPSNLIDGKPVYYLLNQKDLLINPVTYPEAGYLGLVNCTNITIEDMTMENNGQGLLFANTNNSKVTRNNIENNQADVWLSSSSNNIFYENNITGYRFCGAVVYSSTGNQFYHNNFISGPDPDSLGAVFSTSGLFNNWDSGYPSGGNYWSNYPGVDERSGPQQNLTKSDNIGDTPFILDHWNADHYPLMQPWLASKPHDIGIESAACGSTWVYQGFSTEINVTVENHGAFAENVSVTLHYGATGSEIIGAQNIAISPGENQTISLAWNTTGIPYNRNYTLTAVGTIGADRNTMDNTWTVGLIIVRILGDINGDGKVDVRDVSMAARAFGTCLSDSRWVLQADLNQDNKIDIKDIAIVARHFGEISP